MKNKDSIIAALAGLVVSVGFVFAATGLRTLIPETPTQATTATASTGDAGAPAINSYKKVEAPKATSADGVVSAEDWKDIFPNEYRTMKANGENDIQVDYIAEDPYIANLYEGYGFAKDYKSARGHEFDLEDVHETARPHPTANCLTCKTPNFTKLVNDIGVEAYSMDFEEVYSGLNEGISCYNCHENQPGASATEATFVITHSYTAKALGENASTIDPVNIACGQCHTEYHFAVDTKETTVPYTGLDDMTPEAELKYYNDMDFADWTQESTGTKMLKVQHPEFEHVALSGHASMGLNCADCHMAIETAEDGTTYRSHKWESPLDNQAILDTCVQCHGDEDMTAKVKDIQANVTAREKEVGEKLSDLNDKLTDAVAAGTMSEDDLNKIRSLYRDGQWYWDWSYVENSEGAHNSKLDLDCLDRAEKLADEALGLLKA